MISLACLSIISLDRYIEATCSSFVTTCIKSFFVGFSKSAPTSSNLDFTIVIIVSLLVFSNFWSYERQLFIRTLPIILIIKISIFYITGIYKGSWVYSSLEDVLAIVKSVFFSSVVSLIGLVLIYNFQDFKGLIFFILFLVP